MLNYIKQLLNQRKGRARNCLLQMLGKFRRPSAGGSRKAKLIAKCEWLKTFERGGNVSGLALSFAVLHAAAASYPKSTRPFCVRAIEDRA